MARDGLDLAEIFDQIKIGPLSRGMGFGNYHLAPCDAYLSKRARTKGNSTVVFSMSRAHRGGELQIA